MEKSRTLAELEPKTHDRMELFYLKEPLIVRHATDHVVTACRAIDGACVDVHITGVTTPCRNGKIWWRDGWGIHYGDETDARIKA